jgi:hypothetical protein
MHLLYAAADKNPAYAASAAAAFGKSVARGGGMAQGRNRFQKNKTMNNKMALIYDLNFFPRRLKCTGSPGEGLPYLAEIGFREEASWDSHSTTMKIIEVPEEHVVVLLWRREIRTLWIALADGRESMDEEAFFGHFHMSKEYAGDLLSKLSDALELARQERG